MSYTFKDDGASLTYYREYNKEVGTGDKTLVGNWVEERALRDTIDTGIHRGVVQAMSSYVQLLGLTRSSTMPCATAYPHSLAEFDLKSDRLCEETRVQIASAYGKLQ